MTTNYLETYIKAKQFRLAAVPGPHAGGGHTTAFSWTGRFEKLLINCESLRVESAL